MEVKCNNCGGILSESVRVFPDNLPKRFAYCRECVGKIAKVRSKICKNCGSIADVGDCIGNVGGIRECFQCGEEYCDSCECVECAWCPDRAQYECPHCNFPSFSLKYINDGLEQLCECEDADICHYDMLDYLRYCGDCGQFIACDCHNDHNLSERGCKKIKDKIRELYPKYDLV